MNIWIFNHYAIAPGSSGGTRHYDLAKQLVERGHKVTIFTSSFNHQTRREEHFTTNKNEILLEKYYDDVRFIWVKTTPYQGNNWRRVVNMLSYTLRSYKCAKNMEDRPDLVIGSLVHPFAAYLGYLISKHFKCKFYFEERDLWPQTLIDLGKISPKNPAILLLSQLELFLYRKADKVIVLFDKAVNYVVSKGISIDDVLYLPNGVDIQNFENFTITTHELEKLFGNLSGKFVCVYTGSHGIANNLDLLVDTARLLNENDSIHFLFVGDGPEKQRLISRKIDENLQNLTFIDAVAKKYIPYILHKSDLGLISMTDSPLYKWGFSLNKSYDYLASYLPICLLSTISDSIIIESQAVIQVSNSKELAEKIIELSMQRELINQMGLNGRKYVEENHSWEKLATVLEDTFN